jgi:hypothetical protein
MGRLLRESLARGPPGVLGQVRERRGRRVRDSFIPDAQVLFASGAAATIVSRGPGDRAARCWERECGRVVRQIGLSRRVDVRLNGGEEHGTVRDNADFDLGISGTSLGATVMSSRRVSSGPECTRRACTHTGAACPALSAASSPRPRTSVACVYRVLYVYTS